MNFTSETRALAFCPHETKQPSVVDSCSSIAHDQVLTRISMPSNNCMVGSSQLHEKLKGTIREELLSTENLEGCMIMIDTLQRLDIDYHFKEEIKVALSNQYKRCFVGSDDVGGSLFNGLDLFNVSLCFRLLRQEGYHVIADVFNKFKSNDGKFKESLTKDIRGMMSLYEAAQLGIEGEDILEEANVFTRNQLQASLDHLEQDLASLVKFTLKYPPQKRLSRFMTKQYIEVLERSTGANGALSELAKIDFNIVQSLHQKELLQVLGWWTDLGLAQDMKFARDQPVKWYTWSMAALAEPKFSEQRIELTKPISLVYIMDDIFDVYGTLDELILFAEAINRWDFKGMDQLPHQMMTFCKALCEITDDISSKVLKLHGWNPLESLKKAWRSLCHAFLVEAKWFASGQIPKAEAYLKNGLVSTGVHVVFVHIFFLVGEGITKETVELVENIPDPVSYIATILRLWDDLGSAKDENQEGHDGSYIKYYIKENEGWTMENATQHVLEMISTTWKKLNKECFCGSSTPFPPSFTTAIYNSARMVSSMYSYDDHQQLPTLAKYIKSTLFESIPISWI